MEFIYVSPLGSDGAAGTKKEPLKTLFAARDMARNSKDDVTVCLDDGVYFLDAPLYLDERDSGISFKAVEQGNVIVSGGKTVDGWEKLSDNIWRSPLTEPNIVRELYVDGKKANRAASKKRITPLGWYNDLSNLRTEVDGIFVKTEDVKDVENANDVQLHYCRGWRNMTVNIDSIEPYDDTRSIIKSSHPTFAAARSGFHHIAQYTPFIMENAFCFMDTENDFYYNSEEKMLYYYTEKDMTKSECIVPVLEEIVSICGSDLKHKAKSISFDGITFANVTWFRPHCNGLVTRQASKINTIDNKSHDMLDNRYVPAGIRVSAAENIKFTNNVFTGFGGAAIGFYEGVCKSEIDSNVFYDICDGAVTIGFEYHNYEEMPLCGYNHAVRKKARASEEYNRNEASNANCGDLKLGWFTDMPDQWWEVDLGENTEFNRIEMVSHLEQDLVDSRRDFSILASTEENPEKYDLLYSAGHNEAFDFKATLVLKFDEIKKYRYVRVKRDIQHYFYINEVRVIDTRKEWVPFKEVCKNNIISNNIMTRTGLYHWAAPAITAYYTEDLTIIHNTIFNVPYSAISVGWGWQRYPDSTTCKNNTVAYNEVYDDVTVCFDGGAIYTLGNQPGSIIKGNYFHDHSNYPGVIYMDEGTQGYTITENVVENGDVWLFVHLYTSKHIKAYNNYTTSPSYSNQGECSDVWNTKLFIPGKYNADIKAIIDNAGVKNQSLWAKLPKGKAVCEYDKFYNIINETTSVPEPVFVTQYFKKTIFELESIIDLAKADESISEDKINNLEKLLAESYEFLSKRDNSREKIIEYRINLKNSITKILK